MSDQKKTACQVQPDLWFSEERADQLVAKAACMKCPIRVPCEELGWEQPHGIWGGLSELDRKKRDPVRYQEAIARSEKESAEFDVVVAGVIERLREQRMQET